MARSSRPELIKDNPAAPQMFVPRRRRSSSGKRYRDLRAILVDLVHASETFLDAGSLGKPGAQARRRLLQAIEKAQAIMTVESSTKASEED